MSEQFWNNEDASDAAEERAIRIANLKDGGKIIAVLAIVGLALGLLVWLV